MFRKAVKILVRYRHGSASLDVNIEGKGDAVMVALRDSLRTIQAEWGIDDIEISTEDDRAPEAISGLDEIEAADSP